VGGRAIIYLKDDQTHEISSPIDVINKYITLIRTNTGTNPPHIVFKTYVDASNGFVFNYRFNLRNSILNIIGCSITVERSDTTHSPSAWIIASHLVHSSFRLISCTVNLQDDTRLASCRDRGFGQLLLYETTINGSGISIIDVTHGNGILGVFTTTKNATATWVEGLVRDANGTPRNVISNLVL